MRQNEILSIQHVLASPFKKFLSGPTMVQVGGSLTASLIARNKVCFYLAALLYPGAERGEYVHNTKNVTVMDFLTTFRTPEEFEAVQISERYRKVMVDAFELKGIVLFF